MIRKGIIVDVAIKEKRERKSDREKIEKLQVQGVKEESNTYYSASSPTPTN